MRARVLDFAMPWLVGGGFLLLWQLGVDLSGIAPFVLPSPVAVFRAYLQFQPTILRQSLFTLENTLSGFAIGVAGGLALGMLIGSSQLACRGLYPLSRRPKARSGSTARSGCSPPLHRGSRRAPTFA